MLQIIVFVVVFVLLLLAIIPRVLFYAISWRLRQVLPCAIHYSKLNFRGAYFVRISFLTGDSIEIDRVFLTSWLLDSSASSLLCIFVSCIHFYTSPDGLVKIWYLAKCAGRLPTDKPKKSLSLDVTLLKWCSLVVRSCWIHLSYTRTKSINPPQICTLENHKAVTSLMLENVTICGHRMKHEVSVGAGGAVLKSMIWVNCVSGDEFMCKHCGEAHSEADDESSSSNTSCLFCRRFHMCGTFVAMLSTAIELKVGVQDGNISVKVFGTFLMARESNLWEFEKLVGSEEDLSPEAMEEATSQCTGWPLARLSVDFLPPCLSKSKSAVNVNLLRQPIERSLALSSEAIRFTSGAENLSLSVGNLKLLSGRIEGTHEASRELMIERVDVCASLTEDKVDASFTTAFWSAFDRKLS
ncbi:hypothetical protein TcWFU_002728 [Taenia crassiceps]|uniref:Uncharacterized protein n=1 Tax=Taenia crassiceps TaxID=6207 RepID=A0ABR4QAQ5_9CEST